MTRFRYTAAHIEFLREQYQRLPYRQLTAAFNERFGLDKTAQQIKSALRNHGITCGRKTGRGAGCYRLVTREQAAWIREQYQHMPCPELTKAFNAEFDASLTARQIYTFTHNHGITCGRSGRFSAGHKAWNSGTRGVMKPNSGSFEKGHRRNLVPMGSERVDKRDGYILVKVDQVNPYTGQRGWYRHKHVVEWEKAHGAVPEGHLVSFIDGDKTNCDPANLELVTRGEHLQRNRLKLSEQPAELRPAVRAIAKLRARASERSE